MIEYSSTRELKFDPINNAGIDLFPQPNEQGYYYIEPEKPQLISTGVRLKLPQGLHAMVAGRSGRALAGITPFYGIIDSSYRGEIKLIVSVLEPTIIRLDVAIAQLVFLNYAGYDLTEIGFRRVDWIEIDTERGEKGFGSSDK